MEKYTEEQIVLAAKYFAASNTGLVGLSFDLPKSKADVRQNYSSISYEYENETGEGLEEELEMWKESVQTEPEWMERLKTEAPYIFE
jgi:hypothetical protein